MSKPGGDGGKDCGYLTVDKTKHKQANDIPTNLIFVLFPSSLGSTVWFTYVSWLSWGMA